MLENLHKIMHLRFNFYACPMHSPFGFVHLTHQNLSAHALFCLNLLAKVNTQLLIYNYVAERREVGMKSLGFLFEGRGSGNRTSSVNGSYKVLSL